MVCLKKTKGFSYLKVCFKLEIFMVPYIFCLASLMMALVGYRLTTSEQQSSEISDLELLPNAQITGAVATVVGRGKKSTIRASVADPGSGTYFFTPWIWDEYFSRSGNPDPG
jgi:hypothetical protein